MYIYTQTGVPQYCRAKFDLTRKDLMREPFYVAKVLKPKS